MIAWVVCRDGRLPFVAGVFASRARADSELATIPATRRTSCTVESRADLDFPCFILETGGEFEFVMEAEAVSFIGSTQADFPAFRSSEPDEEPVFLIVYRVAEEFAPRRAGADYMGAIPHWHLSAQDLDEVRRHGLSVLWGGSPAQD